MECRTVVAMLPAYRENALPADEKHLVEEHLRSCPACTEELTALVKTERLVSGLDEIEPPPWLTQKIMAHVREEAEQKRSILERLFLPLRLKVPVQVFAVMIVAGLTWYAYKGVGPETVYRQPPSEIVQTAPKEEVPKVQAPPAPQVTPSVPAPAPTADLEKKAPKAKEPVPAVPPASPLQVRPPAVEEQARSVQAPAPERAMERGESDTVLMKAPAPGTAKEREATPPMGAAKHESQAAGGKAYVDGERLKDKRDRVAPAKGVLATAPRQAGLSATIASDDRETTLTEVRRLLTALGAEAVTAEKRGTIDVVKATIRQEKAAELAEKLKTAGTVTRLLMSPGNGDENLPVAIDIEPAPAQ